MGENEKEKSRNWATLVYKESSEADWKEKLEDLKIPCYISPLHDSDTKPNGEVKKPHWHILFTLQGQKTRKAMQKIIELFGGVGTEQVYDKQAYLLYLCHLKNKNKHLYNPKDVTVLNGAEDYLKTIENIQSKCQLIKEMIEWCNENTVYFVDLVDYARTEKDDWFQLLADGNKSHLIWEYLKSKNYKKKDIGR